MKVILVIKDMTGDSTKELVYENVNNISNEGEWWELEVYERTDSLCMNTDEEIREVIQIPMVRILSIMINDIQETVSNIKRK